MDNIQKLILGVLGIAGMLAMLVPSDTSVAPIPIADAVPVPAVVTVDPTASGEAGIAEGENVEESELSDEDIFTLGEPAIDGNPMQGQSDNNLESPPVVTPQYAPDYSQASVVTTQPFEQPSAN